MADAPPPAPQNRTTPLQKRKGESTEQHRALLLYAMQDPKQYSKRAVARGLGRSDASVRKWEKQHDWKGRLSALKKLKSDPTHDAAHLYRTLYFGRRGITEIAAVEHLLPRPFPAATDAIPEDVAEQGQQEQVRRLREQEQKGAAARAAAKSRDEKLRERLYKLIEAYTGYFAQQMSDKKIRPRLADLEIMDRLIDRLETLRQPAAVEVVAEPGSSAPIETARMRIAREQGGDLLDALTADAREVLLILSTLQDNRNAQARIKADADAQTTSQTPSTGG